MIILPGQPVKVRVARENTDVLLQLEDRGYRIPYQVALRLSDLLLRAGKAAEEAANVAQVVEDGAILARAGVPIGLSDDPKVQDEIKKSAAWDKKLRKAMPGGVKSKEVFGKPTLIQGPPPEGDLKNGT